MFCWNVSHRHGMFSVVQADIQVFASIFWNLMKSFIKVLLQQLLVCWNEMLFVSCLQMDVDVFAVVSLYLSWLPFCVYCSVFYVFGLFIHVLLYFYIVVYVSCVGKSIRLCFPLCYNWTVYHALYICMFHCIPWHYLIQGGPKKTVPNFSCNNFGKYGPILIMFSLLHYRLKSTTSPQICCCTTLWKLNVQLYSYLWTKRQLFGVLDLLPECITNNALYLITY